MHVDRDAILNLLRLLLRAWRPPEKVCVSGFQQMVLYGKRTKLKTVVSFPPRKLNSRAEVIFLNPRRSPRLLCWPVAMSPMTCGAFSSLDYTRPDSRPGAFSLHDATLCTSKLSFLASKKFFTVN